MRLTDVNDLLECSISSFESGWIRHPDGRAHVAARTHMIGCKARMVEWRFGYVHTTEHYKGWHPRDHVFSDWVGERGTGRYIGGTHIAHEYFAGGPTLFKLKINFRDPGEILTRPSSRVRVSERQFTRAPAQSIVTFGSAIPCIWSTTRP